MSTLSNSQGLSVPGFGDASPWDDQLPPVLQQKPVFVNPFSAGAVERLSCPHGISTSSLRDRGNRPARLRPSALGSLRRTHHAPFPTSLAWKHCNGAVRCCQLLRSCCKQLSRECIPFSSELRLPKLHPRAIAQAPFQHRHEYRSHASMSGGMHARHLYRFHASVSDGMSTRH